VEITERTPIAFVRNGNEIALIDAHGVILDRQGDVDMRFPIISGITTPFSRRERASHADLSELVRDLNIVNADSANQLSEVDLSNPKNVRIVMAGIPGVNAAQAVNIKFGSGDFTSKYRMLVEILRSGRRMRLRAFRGFAVYAPDRSQSGFVRLRERIEAKSKSR